VVNRIIGVGARPALFGSALGIVASLFLASLISDFRFGVTATDPATFGSVSVLLSLVGLAGYYIPARRAAKVDPIVALRHE
jgi:putative ABC transport system permease protein